MKYRFFRKECERFAIPPSQYMKLSVIIVEYKTPQMLLNCLGSVYGFPTNDIEVIVVDNASGNDIEQKIQQFFPQVRFIQMGYNAGFARANNAGIRVAKGEMLLLLNSDTLVIDDALNKSADMLQSSEYVACGLQLLNEDGTPQISGNFVMKGGVNHLLPLPYLGRFLRSVAFRIKVKRPSIPEAKGNMEVDWVNGAFLMVKRKVMEKAGLLDEDFFLYSEEVEWCSRIKKQGKICIFGALHVYHLQGVSANEAFESSGKGYFNVFDQKGFQILLSMFVRIRKEFGLFWLFFMLLIHLIEIPVFLLGLLITSITSSKQYSFKQWKGYAYNCIRLLNFLPKIVMNRPYFYKVL